jgi:hypothetical protein
MTVYPFPQPEQKKPTVSLFEKVGLDGRVVPKQMKNFWLWYEDNEPELLTVRFA